MDWMFVSSPQALSKVHMLKPNLQCNGIRKWAFGKGRRVGHECGAFKGGISYLIKETPESSIAPSTMRGHRR